MLHTNIGLLKKRIRDSVKNKASDDWYKTRHGETEKDNYDEYLSAMKRVQHNSNPTLDMMTPRERYRNKGRLRRSESIEQATGSWDMMQSNQITTLVSMVPDEIIYKPSDHSIRSYETALMFIDVSGFTELCETYTRAGRGPSKLTQVLNSYIGAMVQEILTHNGDVLKFSGDAFLSMWKKTPRLTMQDVVHTAIDCGLIIQKNYGTQVTDVGVVLKVKVAISAGMSHFSIIGDDSTSHYVIVGQPVWDVKTAEYVSHAGDVLTSASAWMYVNEAEYCTQPCGDGRHTKVLGVGMTWKRVEKIDYAGAVGSSSPHSHKFSMPGTTYLDENGLEISYRGFALRPAMISALRSTWWPSIRRFMVSPVLRAVDNDEPMDFLTEVRHVIVVFGNIVTKTVTEDMLIEIVDAAYNVTSESGGLVNKVSMFDKDMMFLVVFGLRGLKHEDEAQKALLCASTMKERLVDPNIISVSIGVTSGTTYCGVVGHVLRREYTVIGSAVNKAARLMMAYSDKVTCDKETFVRSKLDLEFFRLMEERTLKGIAKPGPIYEFNRQGWVQRTVSYRHPILGRNEELRKFKAILNNAIDHYEEDFTKYRDHVYGVAIIGSHYVGKTRLLEEFYILTPNFMRLEKIALDENDKAPYSVFRKIAWRFFTGTSRTGSKINVRFYRDTVENRIRFSLGAMELTALQIFAINTIFDCRFPLPENFAFTGDLLSEFSVKNIVYKIINNSFTSLQVAAIKNAHCMDDQSWRILIIILETKKIFVILTINDEVGTMSDVALRCLSNNMIAKMYITGLDRWYHGALACQLLDVQAIPPHLEKVIESASGGLPGWIQNFVISLVQRGDLTVVTVPRSEAAQAGAVMPSPILLMKVQEDTKQDYEKHKRRSAQTTMQSETSTNIDNMVISETDMIQMAVLPESYNFDSMKVDMTMDVIILKTYDSLTPFEKMLLKCASVLGEVFTRRMLLYLLQSDSTRKVAKAVAKLFKIRVLECEGGDFTRENCLVVTHPAPGQPDARAPYCACVGTRQPPDCRDLPMYAFCGFMKFRYSLFRTTTYELLTESQKYEMHARALMYLERNTRRCIACGSGCFTKIFGVRRDDGMVRESAETRRVREQICALAAESRMPTDLDNVSLSDVATFSQPLLKEKATGPSSYEGKLTKKITHVRSFASLDLSKCECLMILLSVYGDVIDHIRAVGECDKLFETYMEYADLSVQTLNIPQALRLLNEMEKFVNEPKNCRMEICQIKWLKDYRLARILTQRAGCMFESGDVDEAKATLLRAMELFDDPFPKSKTAMKFRKLSASFKQLMTLYGPSRLFVAVEPPGIVAQYYEDVAKTLNRLFRVFTECKEYDKAALAAKISLSYALYTSGRFRLLCTAFANMITVYRTERNFSRCLKLEKMALEICYRKRGQLDVTEVPSVCALYTSIFLFYVDYGSKSESLELGLTVLPFLTVYSDLTVSQMMVLWMLKLLLLDLRITEMVAIMREFFYMTDHYDLSSQTWYYFYSIVIMLDTGYCVESYGVCEKFYIKKGDAILRSKTPEAAWNFFVAMWLITIRIGAWERTILWEDKIQKILSMTFHKHDYNTIILIRLLEGHLIIMVKEINNRNIKHIKQLEELITTMFKGIDEGCKHVPMYRPRYFLLLAYFQFIKRKKAKAFRTLQRAYDLSVKHAYLSLQIWIQHTKNHWKGTLKPNFLNYWADHIEEEKLLDYRDFEREGTLVVPYTLPTPREH